MVRIYGCTFFILLLPFFLNFFFASYYIYIYIYIYTYIYQYIFYPPIFNGAISVDVELV